MSDTTWFWISYVIQNEKALLFGETVTKKHPFDWNLEVDNGDDKDTRTNILQWRIISREDANKFHERIERRNKK
jgi:hypothetical protein